MPKRRKREKCRSIRISYLFCLLLALAVLAFSNGTAQAAGNPFSNATIRCNVSKSKVNSNNLPSGSSSFNQNDRVYFNATLRNIKITKAELYVTPPGGRQTLVETDKHSYSSYIWMAGSGSGYTLSKSGTYNYVLRLYSGNYSKNYSGAITIAPPNPFPNATIRYNVSKSKVNSSSLPSGSTSFNQNDRVYFNATLRNIKIAKTELYVTPPGGRQTLVETDSHSYSSCIWMAGSGSGYTLSKSGTYNYVLRLYSGNYSKDYSGSISVSAESTKNIITASEIDRVVKDYALNSIQKKALNRINTQYTSKLFDKREDTLIFMFEGCGNDSNVYGGLDGGKDTGRGRANAMCVVVKDKKVVFVNKSSSSLPSTFYPSENLVNGKPTNVPTLESGIYQFRFYSSSGELGSRYELKTMSGSANLPVLRYNRSKKVFESDTSNTIRIHYKGYGVGCQLVSSYTSFLEKVGTTGSSGIYVVDRSFSRDYLKRIGYTDKAIEMLVR